ncbi:hypothetical protein F8M41_001066 [Gigaspora margarita]|uniref:Protein kinase domain-containing protein n=1 Tax=Gigaspora margarita TaxID=4874 RepID=A0A8H3XFM1_GIGMA|nr:hypothetical protein F8M41_001066 [Gigaspora margarita]
MLMTSNSMYHEMSHMLNLNTFLMTNIKFDVYILGIILWEILNKRPLFPSSKSAITLAVYIFKRNGEPIKDTLSQYIELTNNIGSMILLIIQNQN